MISDFEGESGDLVRIEREDNHIEGILMPTSKKHVVLKLANGYNIGIDRKHIKSMNVIKKYEQKEPELEPVVVDQKLPTITVLHTGGTIASRVDYQTGGVIASFKPEELLAMIPELAEYANIDAKLVCNIMSENIRFSHYNILAKAVEEQIKTGVKGVIITHGTDTLHYTAAALSFMLENVPVPVILVGSQRSSDRSSSDGPMNLLSAVYFIKESDFRGVAVCMHENQEDNACIIIPGTKVKKMHSSRRDAFRPINIQPISRVILHKKKIEFNNDEEPDEECEETECSDSPKDFNVKLMDETVRVGIVKSHPNMIAEELLVFKDYDGLVIEGTGLGHLPVIETDEHTKENARIAEVIKDLSEKMPVVMTTQCAYGRVNMNVYSVGRYLRDMDILGNFSDMTPETAFIKLSWVLSNYKGIEEIKKKMRENLRGEIVDRTLDDTFLI